MDYCGEEILGWRDLMKDTKQNQLKAYKLRVEDRIAQ